MLHLAAALDQPSAHDEPSALDPPSVHDADPYVALARLAERGGLDFVTLGDTFARPGPDALSVLSRIAPVTGRIGLVPTVTTTHTEPCHVQAAVATLDRVSRGRAGWRIEVSSTEGEARLSDVVARLWDGREEPRPPQGHPVRVVDATDGPTRRTAGRYADVVLVRAVSPAQVIAVRDQLRRYAVEFGRDPDALRVLASLAVDLGDGEYAAEPGHGGGGPRPTARGPLYRGGPVDLAELITSWYQDGTVDGFHLVPTEPRRDLERLVNGTVALLQHRGLFRTFYPGGTLREHLGLTRPAIRYETTEGAS
ncbi:LLM class flavin-dependent oxidoreductase [Streptomyces sp. YU58]|uniref:LLM class flavin-dependent oxidoreductase n=1 Tax=Streptomyces sp. SX92 TaxID=3158972 RepID=UPI0027BB0D6B|nr:LLM class flavin-dependent oxidoreductase [Streptomyces coralus]WLW56168.1 LLM class flavin-dependent oxidoreductase [Streptomyces coralus]